MRFSHQLQTGLSFGLTSGVITTLGLMVGLFAGTHSRLAVVGGIITIAVADALSDAFGIHISEETEGIHTATEVWLATAFTFVSKFIFASTFLIPILLLPLSTAVVVSVVWGMALLILPSIFTLKAKDGDLWKIVLEHAAIAVLVLAATYLLGEWVATVFG